MIPLFTFAMGILVSLGYYYWCFWQVGKDCRTQRCACGRESSVVTLILHNGEHCRSPYPIPQCKACYQWLMTGASYLKPPWSSDV